MFLVGLSYISCSEQHGRTDQGGPKHCMWAYLCVWLRARELLRVIQRESRSVAAVRSGMGMLDNPALNQHTYQNTEKGMGQTGPRSAATALVCTFYINFFPLTYRHAPGLAGHYCVAGIIYVISCIPTGQMPQALIKRHWPSAFMNSLSSIPPLPSMSKSSNNSSASLGPMPTCG